MWSAGKLGAQHPKLYAEYSRVKYARVELVIVEPEVHFSRP